MASSLLLIPDISGFTEFVNRTEISHSKHIISELLEIIIDADELDLKISEIEGDAILFYKEDSVPDIQSLVDQAVNMFVAFHQHLRLYDTQRICQCGACISASSLTLKIIAHAGEISFTKIRDKEKLFGPDLVVVHKLLKNDIENDEYLLLSDFFHTVVKDSSIQFTYSSTIYHKLGEISYSSYPLGSHYDQVKELPLIPGGEKSVHPIIHEGMINRSTEEVFEVISNLNLRLHWSTGIKELKFEKDRVNRIGTKHVCVFNGGKVEFETITNEFGKDTVVYGEKIKAFPFAKDLSLYYILKQENQSCLIQIQIHYTPNIIGLIVGVFIRWNFKKTLKKSFGQLKQFCESGQVMV